jgi:hypothetical protein
MTTGLDYRRIGLERELIGKTGTLVFVGGANAVAGATIKRVGDGYLVARSVERDRSPAGERVEHELVVPLSGLAYFRTTISDDLDFPIEA